VIRVTEPEASARLKLAAAAHERMAATGAAAIVAAGNAMKTALAAGKSILVFGNGGSAADAQHFAAELVVRYEQDRPGRSALALTTDTSIMAAAGNDRGFEQVFARQIEALGRPGDVALAITTSGTSPNIVRMPRIDASRSSCTAGTPSTGKAGPARRVPSRSGSRFDGRVRPRSPSSSRTSVIAPV